MKECSKSIVRRLMSSDFVSRYFVGDGIDIGGKPDPLNLYRELFPLMRTVRTWDLEDGDAQYLKGLENEAYDFVHSSHCLEHLNDPREGLLNWFRVVKSGGYLVFTVPDEDLYEQGVFPSTFNKDHKWTFTIHKTKSWSSRSINILDLVTQLGERADLHKIQLLNATYRHELPRYDQTLTPIAECGIEVVVRKRTQREVAFGGTQVDNTQPSREIRVHLNQYLDDRQTLRLANSNKPPFHNDDDL